MSSEPALRSAAVPSSLAGGDAAIVIRASLWKTALLIAGSGVFVAVGAWIVRQPDGGAPGWLSIGFFGFCALIGATRLVLGGRLTLSPAGLTLEHMGRRRSWAWDRIGGFRVWSAQRTRLVTFDDQDAKPGALQRINAGLGAGSASLPPSWAIEPQALADLLEDCRRRWS